MTTHLNEVKFDWPVRELSPNWRGHWYTKARAAKRYRRDCFMLARGEKLRVDWDGPVRLEVIFYPPNNRAYDLDNCIAQIKSGLDGLADALRVNDSRFKLEPAPVLSQIREGKVYVRVYHGGS